MLHHIEKTVMAFDGELIGSYVRDAKLLLLPDTQVINIRVDPVFVKPLINVLLLGQNASAAAPSSEFEYGQQIVIDNKYKINIVALKKFDFRALPCHFDCNALALNNDSLYVWKNYPTTKNMLDKMSWFMDRIKSRTFCLMFKYYNNNERINNIVDEAYHLVANGWTMDAAILGPQSWLVSKWSQLDNDKRVKCVECAICQEDFLAGDIVIHTCCNHNFHWHCIRKWVEEDQHRTTCPTCRGSMF